MTEPLLFMYKHTDERPCPSMTLKQMNLPRFGRLYVQVFFKDRLNARSHWQKQVLPEIHLYTRGEDLAQMQWPHGWLSPDDVYYQIDQIIAQICDLSSYQHVISKSYHYKYLSKP